jgi:hypothetical protein
MTFRVITGNTYQGGSKLDGDNQKDGQTRPTELSSRRQVVPSTQSDLDQFPQGGELAPIAQMMDRLEALSFTFEALNAGSRSYSAEAVLETLARMERRDLQALAAIEAFASALKTVSQHLAGLRNAVHSTAHETAAAIDHISNRLNALDGRNGMVGDGNQATALIGIAERLSGIEAKVAEPVVFDGFEDSRLAETMDAIARRVSRIEKKIDENPVGLPNGTAPDMAVLETIARRLSRLEQKIEQNPVGEGGVTTALETIARRVSRIEEKVEQSAAAAAPALDVTPINAALEIIARRVAHIEKKVEEPADLSSTNLEPINAALGGIAQRIVEIEHKIDGEADGSSIAACLMIVADRLSRIETAFSDITAESVLAIDPAWIVEPAALTKDVEPAAVAKGVEPAAVAESAEPAAVAESVESAAPTTSAARNAPDEGVDSRQRVDLLLEQVFRVLSR